MFRSRASSCSNGMAAAARGLPDGVPNGMMVAVPLDETGSALAAPGAMVCPGPIGREAGRDVAGWGGVGCVPTGRGATGGDAVGRGDGGATGRGGAGGGAA